MALPRDSTALTAAALGGPHSTGSGGYRVPRRLRRLLEVRAPRCEWPGCGARAVHCDAEHDLAWPAGPTCACNLGPCCRRHHRVKQLGWTKHRGQGAAVTWTSPGRRGQWLSPPQHDAPPPPTRPLPLLPVRDPRDELTPFEQDRMLQEVTDHLDDPAGLELRVPQQNADPRVHVRDALGDLLRNGRTAWTLDLDDPYAWIDGSDPRA